MPLLIYFINSLNSVYIGFVLYCTYLPKFFLNIKIMKAGNESTMICDYYDRNKWYHNKPMKT